MMLMFNNQQWFSAAEAGFQPTEKVLSSLNKLLILQPYYNVINAKEGNETMKFTKIVEYYQSPEAAKKNRRSFKRR